MAVTLAVVSWHLYTAREPLRELRLMLIAALLGVVFETFLLAGNWVRMAPALLFRSTTPLWMVAIWVAFATTLNVSLRRLRPRYLLCSALASIGAPLAYYSGARLGALQWMNETAALVVIAAGWAVVTPLLMKLAQRFDGFAAV
jgi:hypothetical protein